MPHGTLRARFWADFKVANLCRLCVAYASIQSRYDISVSVWSSLWTDVSVFYRHSSFLAHYLFVSSSLVSLVLFSFLLLLFLCFTGEGGQLFGVIFGSC